MFSFISSHRHIHNVVNTVYDHSSSSSWGTPESRRSQNTPLILPTHIFHSHAHRHDHICIQLHSSMLCANIVEFSNYQRVVIFYIVFFSLPSKLPKSFTNTQTAFCYTSGKCSCLLKTLLERETVVTEIFLDMIHSFSRITWTRHTYPISSGSRNTFPSGLKRDWFPNELSIKTSSSKNIADEHLNGLRGKEKWPGYIAYFGTGI